MKRYYLDISAPCRTRLSLLDLTVSPLFYYCSRRLGLDVCGCCASLCSGICLMRFVSRVVCAGCKGRPAVSKCRDLLCDFCVRRDIIFRKRFIKYPTAALSRDAVVINGRWCSLKLLYTHFGDIFPLCLVRRVPFLESLPPRA